MNSSVDGLVNSAVSQDTSFGPTLHGPNAPFDFTLSFERSILSILPSALFLLYVPARAWWLRSSPKKARWGRWVVVKQLLYILLFAAQTLTLVFTAISHGGADSQTAIAAQSLLLVVALGLGGLSTIEHGRSPRSSDAINVYLFFSTIFDGVQVRSLWLRDATMGVRGTVSACFALKVVILLAEAQGKVAWLLEEYRGLAPETLSGVYARRVFWWLNGLMGRGYSAIFRPADLMAIKEEFASKRLLHALETQSNGRGLLAACLRAFRGDMVFLVLPRILMLALSYTQPFLFEAIISHLDLPAKERDANSGYGLIVATGLLYLSLAISKTYYQHKTYQLVTKVRGVLVSLLYARTLDSAPGSLTDRAPVTLMSVDVDGITNVVPLYNEIWASAVEIGIAVYLLQRQLEVVWVVPFGVAFCCSGLAVYLSRKMGPRQAKWNAVTQERVSATSLVLGFIKSIKMMGYSKYANDDIRNLRDKEIRTFKVFRRYTVFLNALGNLPFYAGPVLTFTVFAFVGKEEFSIGRAFTSLSLISLLEMSTLGFIASLPQIAAASGCLKRLEAFLHEVKPTGALNQSTSLREIETLQEKTHRVAPSENGTNTPIFSFRNAILKPSSETNGFALRDINLDVNAGSFFGVTGPAGSGKTTLIKALLNRLPVINGQKLQYSEASVVYCAQTPWLPNVTIKEAIIGESEPDEEWYERVVSACALDEDLRNLEARDQTSVGSQGTNLSGGQRQRVALARALFCRRKVFVFDDILSGMDAHTTAHICRSVFSKEGMLRELGATVAVVSHSPQVLCHMDDLLRLESDGRIQQFHSSQDIVSESASGSSQSSQTSEVEANLTSADQKAMVTAEAEEAEVIDTARQTGDWALYKHYITSVGWWRMGLLAGSHLVGAALDNFPTVWLKQWSSVAQDPNAPDRTAFYLGIYGATALLGIICILFGIWFIYMILIPAAGRNMHDSLLHTVIHAQQSFHDTTPTGTTLNRFTQDMQHIDRDVPSATLRCMHATADCLAAFVLLSISASYTAAFIPLLLVALYYLQKFYLRTSRQLRLLEIEARAPLFTVFQEAVDGLDTIVSTGWGNQWREKLFTILDASQRPYYLLFCIQRWLIIVLGFVVAAMATILVTFAMQIQGLSSAGAIGVGLIALLNFNDRLNLLIVEWTTLETSLGAIARLKAFSQNTAVEEDGSGENVGDEWPRAGSVEFKDVGAQYRDDPPPVLKNLSFNIPSGSTCAIVGRTGSGKSSTLSVLMRMLPLSSGSIIIDGLPHTSVPLQILRSRIACLPQQPYLLPGSLRRNLDPGSQLDNADLRAALERVRLWSVFCPSSQSVSTATTLTEQLNPDALTPGQTQLLVLARTLLLQSRPKILVLDEVTSSLDDASEELMQQLIREEFVGKGCTVIVVTHRLRGIVDFDQVVVLDAGRVVEVGRPRALLGDEGSVFGRIVGS
ncbi:P-loop containing nucleoside triphosphate hydrolase protein, partial [Bimuria novae-zelandiae CBS 107.79]